MFSATSWGGTNRHTLEVSMQLLPGILTLKSHEGPHFVRSFSVQDLQRHIFLSSKQEVDLSISLHLCGPKRFTVVDTHTQKLYTYIII